VTFADDLEGVKPQKRTEIDVKVSARDQVEYFSPPFESAIRRGKAQSMMCRYGCKICTTN
jgi:beta-glucosidase-like glycosyl hydrolase